MTPSAASGSSSSTDQASCLPSTVPVWTNRGPWAQRPSSTLWRGSVAELRGGGRGHTGSADRQHMDPPGPCRQRSAHWHPAAADSSRGRFLVCLGRLPSVHLHLRRAVTTLEELATLARSPITGPRLGRLDRRR